MTDPQKRKAAAKEIALCFKLAGDNVHLTPFHEAIIDHAFKNVVSDESFHLTWKDSIAYEIGNGKFDALTGAEYVYKCHFPQLLELGFA